MKVVTVKEMQFLDNKTIMEFGLPALLLMERAALGVMEVIEKELANILYSKEYALIAVGTGNNGGDGLAVARLLYKKGKKFHIILIGEESKRSVENKIQLDIISRLNIPITDYSESESAGLIKNSDLIIDAIFGIGLTRKLSGNYKKLVGQINQSAAIKIALDIPSGLNGNSGEIMGDSVKADYTVTFAFPKTGLLTDQALNNVGNLHVVDIGIPEIYEKNLKINYVTRKFIKEIMPVKREKSVFKSNYGRTILIGGSDAMSGAIVLASKAALRSGAGLVNVMVPENIHSIVAGQIPAAMVFPLNEKHGYMTDKKTIIENLDRADSIVFGPGAGKTPETEAILKYLIKNYKNPLVIDADGLNLLADNPELMEERTKPLILTPHVGELSRLLKTSTKEIQKDRFAAVKSFCKKYAIPPGKLIIVFKGAKTLISDGDEIYINSSGNPALARGGSGDILSGLIGGLLAQKMDHFKAAILGVYLHGMMADIAIRTLDEQAIITEELIDFIPQAFSELRKEIEKTAYLLLKDYK